MRFNVVFSALVDLDRCPVKTLTRCNFIQVAFPAHLRKLQYRHWALAFGSFILAKHTVSCSVFAPFYHGKPVMDELSIENLCVCVCVRALLGSQVGWEGSTSLWKLCLGPAFPCLVYQLLISSETNNAAGQYRVRAMGSLSRNAKHPETNPEVWEMVMDLFLLVSGTQNLLDSLLLQNYCTI